MDETYTNKEWPKSLNNTKLSELAIVGWYDNGKPYLSSWMGEVTFIEVVGPAPYGHKIMDPSACRRHDNGVSLRTFDGDYRDKLVVIAFGRYVE